MGHLQPQHVFGSWYFYFILFYQNYSFYIYCKLQQIPSEVIRYFWLSSADRAGSAELNLDVFKAASSETQFVFTLHVFNWPDCAFLLSSAILS